MNTEPASRPRQAALLAALLVAATVLAYQPAWHAGFIWDDDVYVTNNRLLTAPDGLRSGFGSPSIRRRSISHSFTPSCGWSAMLWGLAPGGYHWVNIILHAANALLLWRVLRRMAVPGAWLGAALFALHPVQVESVAWVTELKNVLSVLFSLLAVRAWLEFVEDRPDRWRFYAAALICQFLALAAKTTACTLPAALLLMLWIQQQTNPSSPRAASRPVPCRGPRDGNGQRLVRALPPVHCRRKPLRSARLSACSSPAGPFGFTSANWSGRSISHSVTRAGRSIPAMRCPTSGSPPPRWPWRRLFGPAKVAGRGPETAAIYYVAMLSPLLGLIMEYTFRYSYVADHYQYAACIGPLALAAAGIDRLLNRAARPFPAFHPIACGLLLALLGILTWRQCRIYENSETLWRATLDRSPGSLIARNNLSQALLDKGDVDGGLALSREVLAMDPNDAVAQNNLGFGLLQKGQLDDAIAHCRKSIALQPNAPDAYYNIGQAFLKKVAIRRRDNQLPNGRPPQTGFSRRVLQSRLTPCCNPARSPRPRQITSGQSRRTRPMPCPTTTSAAFSCARAEPMTPSRISSGRWNWNRRSSKPVSISAAFCWRRAGSTTR